jgi:hypothetical protein
MALYMAEIIYTSAIYSLVVQFIIGIICFAGLFIPLDEEDQVLNSVLLYETIVQAIEFTFYIWLIYSFHKIEYDVTFVRYFDWILTTPTMLFTMIVLMIYNEKSKNETLTIKGILQEEYFNIGHILGLNAAMLLFGFMAEYDVLDRMLGFVFGSIAFVLSYYYMYINYVGNNTFNKYIFYANFIIWSGYGVAYLFPYATKNTMYNILDIFSKNITGILVLIYILIVKYYLI